MCCGGGGDHEIIEDSEKRRYNPFLEKKFNISMDKEKIIYQTI